MFPYEIHSIARLKFVCMACAENNVGSLEAISDLMDLVGAHFDNYHRL